MPKAYRPKRIGDPFKKFKQLHRKPVLEPTMRKYLEKAMEEDHRAGLPFRAAMYTSNVSGLPDAFFFEKARALGYEFDDEREFAFFHIDACGKLINRVRQYALDFEKHLLCYYTKPELIQRFGSMERFRELMEARMKVQMETGGTFTFGVNEGVRTNAPEGPEFIDNSGEMLTMKQYKRK